MLVHHALVLNLHQPSGNLEELLAKPNLKGEDGWEGKEILFALDRIPRALWGHEARARVHLALSGTLLETLRHPGFQEQAYGIVRCGDLLWHYQNREIIDILGMGFYHPVLPLIPEDDWDDQVSRWKGLASHLFARDDFQGFWPPEMGFCMEMIPMLRRHGYRYVLVDSENVEPVTPMSWQELRYRPHVARYGDDEIIVVVRDRELSDAQESGMDVGWFLKEVEARTSGCAFVPLVTTATDGDNGGWFRNFREKSNFWNAFYLPLLESIGSTELSVEPVFIHKYLDWHGVHGEVRVEKAAWNTGWHNGKGFVQWTGSELQKEALDRVELTSVRWHALSAKSGDSGRGRHELDEARWRLLRAQTSCNFYWGEAWVSRAHADLDEAWEWIHRAESVLG